MYCTNCGKEITQGCYCPNCGTYIEGTAEISVSEPLSDAQRLKKALTSKLFLVIAILASVSFGISILILIFGSAYTGVVASLVDYEILDVILPIVGAVFAVVLVFSVLNLISYWRTYIRNKKSETPDASGPRLMYILNKISVVIMWIMAVLLVVLGIAAFAIAIMSGDLAVDIATETMIMLAVFGFVFGLIGVIYIVMLLMYYRKFLRLFRQIAESAESGVWNIDDAKVVYIWTLVLGIISAVGGITNGGVTLVSAASTICLSFWIKENFVINE